MFPPAAEMKYSNYILIFYFLTIMFISCWTDANPDPLDEINIHFNIDDSTLKDQDIMSNSDVEDKFQFDQKEIYDSIYGPGNWKDYEQSNGNGSKNENGYHNGHGLYHGDCSCNSFVNKNGYGQCKKNSRSFGGLPICYVNLPSTCTDIIESQSDQGWWKSAEACKVRPDCSCNNFVNKNGYGQCKKSSRFFGGLPICYVNLPSTCTDIVESGSDKGWWKSSEACKVQSDCSCNDFVNEHGFGQCKKGSRSFGGLPICYVNLPSTCNDIVESESDHGWVKSAEACKGNSGENRCKGRPCGEDCENGICDGNGNCVSPGENPCVQYGCGGKLCGNECLMGDILGACDVNGNCENNVEQALTSCNNQGPKYSEKEESLSPDKVGVLLEAMRKVHASPDWEEVASVHGAPVRPECAHREGCCIHEGNGGFLPWHRIYMDKMNEAIQKHEPTVTIPYWDWTTLELPTIANSHQIRNPINGQSMENPFFSGFIPYSQTHTERTLNLFENISTSRNLEDVLTALQQKDFLRFSQQLQSVHNDIHVYIGGHMINTATAAYDPIFYLHHSMVDLVWAVYQKLNPPTVLSTNVTEIEMIPWDISVNQILISKRFDLDMNSNKIVFGGMTLKEIKDRIEPMKKRNRVYAGFVLRNFNTSGTINFNTCVQDDCSYPGGHLAVFGSKNEVPYINSDPTKVDVTDVLIDEGIIANIENIQFNVTSFVTPEGNRSPLEVYTPLRIVRMGTTGEDVYCVFFDKIHMGPPIIRLPKNTKLEIESSHGKIYETKNEIHYGNCNKKDNQGFTSGLGMDLNPGNYFFFDDNCKSETTNGNHFMKTTGNDMAHVLTENGNNIFNTTSVSKIQIIVE